MAAHSLSKSTTEAPKAQEELAECQAEAPASNQEALELLGMGSADTVQDIGADPQSLAEEILSIDPSMVGIILGALPLSAVSKLGVQMLTYAPVREWLLEQGQDVILAVSGASEVVLEELVPVGCGLEVGTEFDAASGEVVAGGASGMVLTRTGVDVWTYVLSTQLEAGLGVGVDSKVEFGGAGAKLEDEIGAEASLTKTLGLEAVFSEARSPEGIVQLILGSGELSRELGRLASLGLLTLAPDEFAVSSTLSASAGASIKATLLTDVSPHLGRQVDVVGAEMGWELAAGQECRWSGKEGLVQTYEVSSKSTFGPVLEGYLPWLRELGESAEQEGVTLSVRLKIISTRPQLLDITYVEDLESGMVTRVYSSFEEFVGGGDQRFDTLDVRLATLAGANLSMLVDAPLPREEEGEYGVQGPNIKTQLLENESSLKIVQAIGFKGAVELPSHFRSQFFQGGDTALFRALVQVAREGSSPDLQLTQELAWLMLTVEEPRVVGTSEQSGGFKVSEEGIKATDTTKGRDKKSLSTSVGLTRHIDLPYTGTNHPMK